MTGPARDDGAGPGTRAGMAGSQLRLRSKPWLEVSFNRLGIGLGVAPGIQLVITDTEEMGQFVPDGNAYLLD